MLYHKTKSTALWHNRIQQPKFPRLGVLPKKRVDGVVTPPGKYQCQQDRAETQKHRIDFGSEQHFPRFLSFLCDITIQGSWLFLVPMTSSFST